MKREGYLYEKIINIDNLYKAEKKARLGKKNRKDIKQFVRNLDDNILQLYNILKENKYETGEYYHFIIYEPKARNISKLPYRDRILHHAIIQILEPIFVNSFISQTYSCIKRRGIHKALYTLRDYLKDIENTKYCLKLDIKKFYPSINNELLKKLLRNKFKDEKLLNLLDNIINSIQGLPLGSYTSQFFANFYINGFCHWLKEENKIQYLLIYCDDIVILNSNKIFLSSLRKEIQNYLKEYLQLELSNYQIFPISMRGIDFLGYKTFHTHCLLRKTIKLKFIKMIKENKNDKSIASYNGWISYCNGKNLWNKYINNGE